MALVWKPRSDLNEGVLGREKWTRAEYYIDQSGVSPGHVDLVEGYVWSYLGVRKTKTGEWVAEHLPSGAKVSPELDTMRAARNFAEAVESDYSAKVLDVDELKRARETHREIARGLGWEG